MATSNFKVSIIPRPNVSLRGFFSRGKSFPLGKRNYFSSGRVALSAILSSIRSKKNGSQVLVPSYVCSVVLDACRWSGLTPVSYSVNEDLTVDLVDVQEKLSDSVVALVAVHFFGKLAELDSLSEACKDAGIPMIEDAAHLDIDNQEDDFWKCRKGSWIFSSLRKFSGTFDGAIAVPLSPESAQSLAGADHRLLAELRGLKNNFEILRGPGPVVQGSSNETEQFEEKGVKAESASVHQHSVQSEYVDSRFKLDSANAMTWSSRVVARLNNRSCAGLRRSEIFCAVRDASTEWDRARLLFQELEQGSVPYVIPVLLNDSDADYHEIRQAGVEALRWENLGDTGCRVCVLYERRLIQIPCHEQMSNKDVDFLIDTLRGILVNDCKR
ncbi:MAG: aminotransferase class I/II-fold pyridoxal phosphate-dependent enzyme [Woeseiaceae bacterium]